MTSLSPAASPRAAPSVTRRTFAGLDLATWVALGLLVLAGLLYSLNLTGRLYTDDEESYLYQAWRVSLGELPYRDFLTPQLPGFLGLGGLVLRLAGPSLFAPRLLAIAMTLLAGWFVYRMGRRLYAPWVGVAALTLFLAYPRVVDMARLYRPEAFMLAMQTTGLYAFIVAYDRRHRWGLAGAGVVLGLAVLMKLFGALTLLGVFLFLAYEGARRFRPWREVIVDGAVVGGAAAAVVLGVMGVFMLIAPQTYAAVLGHHLMQGTGLSHWETAQKGLEFLVSYFHEYTTVLVLALVGAALALRERSLRAVLAWQLPTALAFVFLSRELFLRHTVYLAPAVCLLAVGLLEPLFDPARVGRWGRVIAVAVTVAVMAPWLRDSYDDNKGVDDSSWRLMAYLNAVVPPGAPLAADNSGVNFYIQRPTTPTAASLSKGATESGQITAARLVPEMERQDVNWILLATDGPGQTFQKLKDRDTFLRYVEEGFEPVTVLARERQLHTLYRRKGATVAPPSVAVGPLNVTLLASPSAQPGGTTPLTLALAMAARPEPGLSARLAAIDEQGSAVAETRLDLDTFGLTPLKDWSPGATTIGHQALTLPATAPTGDLELYLEVESHDGNVLGQAPIGTLRVARRGG